MKNTMMKNIEMIERIDQLIRRSATGTADDLALRLGISRTKVYRTIEVMKLLGAPIEYDTQRQTFYYEEEVGFNCGFFQYRQQEPYQPQFV